MKVLFPVGIIKFRSICRKEGYVSISKSLFYFYFCLRAFLISDQELEVTQNFLAVNVNFNGSSKIRFEKKKKPFSLTLS